jgi:ligand-binding sensor domain-containing protein/two-component sensor histidine kinase
MRWRFAFMVMALFHFLVTGAQKLIFKTYTVNDGLVANVVRRIFQDSKGFIWVCTWDGLSKYDGDKFINFTSANGLSDNSVNDVYEAPDGKIYVALNTGVVDLIENDHVSRRAVFRNIVINQFFNGKFVFAVTDTNGILQFNGTHFTKIRQQDPKRSYSRMIALHDSLFAVCSPEIPVRIFSADFTIETELQSSVSTIECIYEDTEKRIWIGTPQGLKLFSLSSGEKPVLNEAILPHALLRLKKIPATGIVEEPKGNFWIGTSENLLHLRSSGVLEVYSDNSGLPSNQIFCLLKDREGNIWIGTSLGLSKLTGQNNIQIFTTKDGVRNQNIEHLFTDGRLDRIYIGTRNPKSVIQQFDMQKNTFISMDYPLGKIQSVKGIKLFFSNHDLKAFNNAILSLFKHLNPVKRSFFCGTVSEDHIFMGTDKGILIGSTSGNHLDSTVPFRVQCLLNDRDGNLWVGTWENGLFCIRNKNIDKPSVPPDDFSSLLPDKHIRSLYQDKNGNIWVGTRYRGLVRIIYAGRKYQTEIYDQNSGLASNFIRAIGEDQKGNIWVGSFIGLDKLVASQYKFTVFNFSRINNVFGAVNDLVCVGDEVWCGTTEGLIHIKDNRLETSPPLPVYLSSVLLGGKSRTTRGSTLSYSENTANFEFTSPGFINEKQIQYSYRLLGSPDTIWSTPTNIHSVSYASLEPGRYQFQVRALGWNGRFGPPGTFGFIIRAPFWRTWWFILSISLLVIGFFYLLYRYRINQLVQLQRVRNRLAIDLHDDIGSTLTNISILSELGRKNAHQPEQSTQFLQRIIEEVGTSSQALDDIVWSVNTRNDSMEETFARMRRYAAELFDNAETRYHIHLDETNIGKKIGMEQRRDFYLIYKESLNNIYKHAQAKNIWVEARYEYHMLRLSISDDGKGFAPGQPNSRNGLKNLRWRAEKWKGDFMLESTPGKGTAIVVSMPVP